MTAVIQWEFSVVQNGLPVAYLVLLTGQIQRLLKDDSIAKSQWIRSVWNARGCVRITAGLGGWERNQIIQVTFKKVHPDDLQTKFSKMMRQCGRILL